MRVWVSSSIYFFLCVSHQLELAWCELWRLNQVILVACCRWKFVQITVCDHTREFIGINPPIAPVGCRVQPQWCLPALIKHFFCTQQHISVNHVNSMPRTSGFLSGHHANQAYNSHQLSTRWRCWLLKSRSGTVNSPRVPQQQITHLPTILTHTCILTAAGSRLVLALTAVVRHL